MLSNHSLHQKIESPSSLKTILGLFTVVFFTLFIQSGYAETNEDKPSEGTEFSRETVIAEAAGDHYEATRLRYEFLSYWLATDRVHPDCRERATATLEHLLQQVMDKDMQ